MTSLISESRFYMWRSLFALVHTDGRVSKEEVHYLAEVLEDIPFSEDQAAILREDINTAQDVFAMFEKVAESKDQAEFFKYAREICHADGDYGVEEQDIMLKLQRVHMSHASVDDLVGSVELSFDDDTPAAAAAPNVAVPEGAGKRFLNLFRKKKNG